MHTKEKAEKLGITGWIKNAPDGSVEIHAEGTEDALKELEEWCHHGPPAARVDLVESKDSENKDLKTFTIE